MYTFTKYLINAHLETLQQHYKYIDDTDKMKNAFKRTYDKKEEKSNELLSYGISNRPIYQ